MSIWCWSHYTTPNKDSKENIPKVVNHLKAREEKEEGVVQVQQIISYLLALQWLLFFNLSNIIKRGKILLFLPTRSSDRHIVREIGLLNMKETLGRYIKTVHSHLWGAIVWHKATDKGMKDIFSRQMAHREREPPWAASEPTKLKSKSVMVSARTFMLQGVIQV